MPQPLPNGGIPQTAPSSWARGAALRRLAVEELRKRREEVEWALEVEFDRYVDQMSRSGTWGGEIELLMLSHRLGCPIEVYLRKQTWQRIQSYGEEYASQPALYVLFHDGMGHYEALWKQGGGAGSATSKL